MKRHPLFLDCNSYHNSSALFFLFFRNRTVQVPPIAKTVEKEKQCESLEDSHFSVSKVSRIKIVWYWHKDKYMDQHIKIKSPEINPNLYDQFILDKCAKTIQWGKESCQQMVLGQLDRHM